MAGQYNLHDLRSAAQASSSTRCLRLTAVKQPVRQPPYPHLHILRCPATHGMLLLKDVYMRRWRTHNTPERRIYTSVAANVLIQFTLRRGPTVQTEMSLATGGIHSTICQGATEDYSIVRGRQLRTLSSVFIITILTVYHSITLSLQTQGIPLSQILPSTYVPFLSSFRTDLTNAGLFSRVSCSSVYFFCVCFFLFLLTLLFLL